MVAAVVVLAGCGASTGSGARSSGSRSPQPSHPAASPTAATASASAGTCAAGHAEVIVSPGDPVRRRLCVRPGTVVTLVLRPRVDDKRWAGALSSAPALVLPSGWRLDGDGTAHATLRCAGTRGGTAEITLEAKAPDVAGAARGVFTLEVSVVPYPQNG
ncbi:hypothetical protein Scel_21870 [Streptomyces cellostaticus]|nr:hypothetical protein Scel_21870 [Streptomyces cellostaticus]